jgi:hypothetical protein
MHLHGVNANNYTANLHSSANATRAMEAQRAAETRKRLLKNAQSVQGESGLEESRMIGRWLGAGQNQGQGQGQGQSDHHLDDAERSGKDLGFG